MNYRIGIALTILTLSVGCGGGDDTKTVYQTTGKLTLDGKPFGPTSIMLVDRSKEKPKSVVGQVDKDGNVTFTTYDIGDGVPEGSYSVVVGMEMKAPPAPFPKAYTDMENSPLMVDVKPEDGQELTLAMDSKTPGPKFNGPRTGRSGADLNQAMKDAFPGGAPPTGNE